MNELRKTILRREARIGAKVFPNPERKKREFYCLDENTWLWRQDSATVLYRVNSANIQKSNDGISFRLVGENEAKRLFDAAKTYRHLMETKVYGSLLSLR